MRKNKKYIKIFSYNILILIIGIVIIELIFGSWIFSTNFNHYLLKEILLRSGNLNTMKANTKPCIKKIKMVLEETIEMLVK